MMPWKGGRPATLEELFDFYHSYVKLLYSSVQSQNALPIEVLFELNAALDHISRHWTYGESEAEVVARAYSHLKRSCLDVFKLKVKDAVDQYQDLCKIDVSIIDNGEFDRDLRVLYTRIRHTATEARRLEGRTEQDDSVPAFGAWERVFVDCVALEQEFFLSPKVSWAKRRGAMQSLATNANAIAISCLTSAFIGYLSLHAPSDRVRIAHFMFWVVAGRAAVAAWEKWRQPATGLSKHVTNRPRGHGR